MRGREPFGIGSGQANLRLQQDPSSVSFADTFSRKGRRTTALALERCVNAAGAVAGKRRRIGGAIPMPDRAIYGFMTWRA